MEEIFKWIKEYWTVVIGVGGLVIYMSKLGIGLKQNDEFHQRHQREFEIHKAEEHALIEDLRSKYESLASAFHNTEVEQGKMLASIQTTLEFIQKQQEQLLAKIEKIVGN